MDVASFLRRFPPFDALDEERLGKIAGSARSVAYPKGSVILRQSGAPAHHLYVIHEGSVEVLADGRLLDLMGEGEVFGQMSIVTGLEPTATIRAREDTACYLLDATLAGEVLGTPEGVSFVTMSLRRRIERLAQERASATLDPGLAAVGSLIRRAPLTCEPDITVGRAASLMADAGVSSILVGRPGTWGIVTDRDLRTKVLGSGRGSDTPVSEVMTFPAIVVHAGVLAAEALSLMIERRVHHLPILDDRGELVGVVSETDLVAPGPSSPFTVRKAVERARDAESAVSAARGIPGMAAALVEARVDPVDIGRLLGETIDALTTRLLEFAAEELGPAPVPWAWLALGSQARHEQALHTDQDHALAYDPQDLPADVLDPHFEQMARFVTDGLERAGIPRCRAGIIAENRGLRRPLEEWALAFRKWMGVREWEGTGVAAIVFDYRRVAGPLDVEPVLDGVIAQAHDDAGFLHRLTKNALDNRPPTGFFQDFVVEAGGEHAGRLDVKHGGIMPITDLARIYGVAAGVPAKRTPDRLRDAAAAGRIDGETSSGVDEAFRLLWHTRLDHQAACVRTGVPPDDFVDPKALPPLSRQGLREAFRIIARAQRALRGERWGTGE